METTHFTSAGTLVPTTIDCQHLPSCALEFGSVGIGTLASNREQPLSCAPTILPNGINTESRPIASIDWSRSEILVKQENGTIVPFKTLTEAAPHYKGYVWVLESTADSFELQNRQTDLKAIEVNNIRAYCFSPKHTSRYRMRWGIPKSDKADVGVILRIFTETNLTCSRFEQIIEKEKDKLRIASQKALIRDRREDGEESEKMIAEYLPHFKDVPTELYECLYKPTKAKNPKKRIPRIQVPRYLIIARMVRQAGGGFRTFRRLVGNYGNGFGCMARSEFYHHHVGSVCDAKVKAAGIERKFKEGDIDPKTREKKNVPDWTQQEYKIHKQAMKDVSRVVRWLWQRTAKDFKDVGTCALTNNS